MRFHVVLMKHLRYSNLDQTDYQSPSIDPIVQKSESERLIVSRKTTTRMTGMRGTSHCQSHRGCHMRCEAAAVWLAPSSAGAEKRKTGSTTGITIPVREIADSRSEEVITA
jgi:hypothetical protein